MGSGMMPPRSFKPLRDWLLFTVEWQRVTGRLLLTEERTREAGLAKLEDADKRERENKHIGERKK